MQQRSLSIISKISTSYTTTNTWANVTGLVITFPEDGVCDLAASFVSNIATNTRENHFRFAINGNAISGTETASFHTSAGNSYFPHCMTKNDVPLKAGDVVSVQAIYVVGSGAVVYSAGTTGASIQVTKRGL